MLTLNWHEFFIVYMTKTQTGGELCLQRFVVKEWLRGLSNQGFMRKKNL